MLYSFGTAGDAENPNADLLDVNGTLYGTSTMGGRVGIGTVFAVAL